MSKAYVLKSALFALALSVLGAASLNAQEFLRNYRNLNDKNVVSFLESWQEWSEQLAKDNAGSEYDALTSSVFSQMAAESDFIARSQQGPKYIVLSTELVVKIHSDKYKRRKVDSDKFNGDVVSESTILPVVNASKPVLYLNDEIAGLLNAYLSKDKTGKRMELIRAYLPAVKESVGAHLCTLPFISKYDVFPDAVVVNCRDSWGTGCSYLYEKSGDAFVRDGMVSSWFR